MNLNHAIRENKEENKFLIQALIGSYGFRKIK